MQVDALLPVLRIDRLSLKRLAMADLGVYTADMQKSDSVNAISKALALAQSEIQLAQLDKENPHFKSKYATLASIVSSSRQALSKNELSVIQSLDSETNVLFLTTRLQHSSGQFFESRVEVRPVQNTPQAIGSALTYLRRYSYAAITGVSPAGEEDDDGNHGSEGRFDRKPTTKKEKTDAPASHTVVPRSPGGGIHPKAPPQAPAGKSNSPARTAGKKERAHIAHLAEELGWKLAEVAQFLPTAFDGKKVIEQLTLEEYESLVRVMANSTFADVMTPATEDFFAASAPHIHAPMTPDDNDDAHT